MIAGSNGAYIGLLSFLSFGLSVIAAVLAIDMYTLLRTGEFGKTWRVLIIASVMFALAQVMRMAEILDDRIANFGISQIVELMFVITLAYAFFLQRKAFTHVAALRGERRRAFRRARDKDIAEPEEVLATPSGDLAEAVPESIADEAHDAPSFSPDEDPDIEWSPKPRRRPKAPTSLLN